MPFELKLAWKYFRARRKSLARFTSFVAIIGIAAGVASLIIAQSLARGFADEMRGKILANTAHITIFSSDGLEIANWREIREQLENTEKVGEVSATTYANAIVIGDAATSYAILRVRNSSQQSAVSSQQSERPKTEDRKPAAEISVGVRLAEKLNLKTGDKAEIVTLENQDAPKRTFLRVKDVFQTGLYEYDSTWIYTSPETFAYLTGKKEFTPTILSVSVRDIYKANETADKIRASLGNDFKVVDWQEANQPLFAALSLERKFAFAVISLIIFIAALNITTTLALLVNERKFDIAILRTCGARARSLIFIFLYEGLFLGFIGIVSGVILGLLACFLGNRFKIVSLSAEVYSLNYIPFHPSLTNILFIILIAFALCLTATIYPAFRASRVKPLENLRTQ
ncbi:MAG TPA: ABC transporter permease [Pyrinomonadaceae bacterium]|nr:ABC transporter permease [Pyrinomonadaceae bacterium]